MNKALYDDLLKTEQLFEMCEGMTGDWSKDKSKFIRQHEILENYIKNIETEDEEFID